jgi:UDPglucose--hexose-1-phosphate uridylyltransferase
MSPLVRVTPIRLADGRELIYFDDSPDYVTGAKTREATDPRPLTPRDPSTAPEMRLDQLTGDWIPMAAERMDRTFRPARAVCPLCPADPDGNNKDREIPASDYDVVVFENRFPSYWSPPGQDPALEWLQDGDPLRRVRHAAGRCEVVCFSSDHNASMADFGPTRMRTVIEAWAARTESLRSLTGVEEVFVFENRGPEIGVTLSHPHGQIYGYPALTPKTRNLLRQARAHRARTGRNLLADVLASELAGPRVVLRTDHWAAYVPHAARWPIELHLAPLRDAPDLPDLTEPERADLASVYPRLLRAFDRFHRDDAAAPPLPYISGWHQAPLDPAQRALSRLQLQLFSIRRAPGKLKHLAGSESGMGAWVADSRPEAIAERLTAALAEADAAGNGAAGNGAAR